MNMRRPDRPPPLFGGAASAPEQPQYAPGSESSREASASTAKQQRAARRWQVLAAVKRSGSIGKTNQELAEETGIRETSICALTNELARLGLIEKQAQRRQSHLSDGRRSQVRHQVWQARRLAPGDAGA
jgi:hypothetical protein